mmetsp:Transcript_44491/g.53827  ORF Transcript_44491/g.53827 Transcript_44491/m.53827 type:complete len:198 (-) Transcript_44491:216-809(-)
MSNTHAKPNHKINRKCEQPPPRRHKCNPSLPTQHFLGVLTMLLSVLASSEADTNYSAEEIKSSGGAHPGMWVGISILLSFVLFFSIIFVYYRCGDNVISMLKKCKNRFCKCWCCHSGTESEKVKTYASLNDYIFEADQREGMRGSLLDIEDVKVGEGAAPGSVKTFFSDLLNDPTSRAHMNGGKGVDGDQRIGEPLL